MITATSPPPNALRIQPGFSAKLVGDAANDFELEVDAQDLRLRPMRGVSQHRVLRAAALLQVGDSPGYPELNLMMGRIHVAASSQTAVRYTPFSHDPQRALRRVWLCHERDGRLDSTAQSTMFEDFEAFVPDAKFAEGWEPARRRRVCERISHLDWHAHGWIEAVEMHWLDALVRCSHRRDLHVVEIGSYQGRSTSVLAAAMGDVDSDGLLFSIDPNLLSAQQGAIAAANVASVGQARRLVQLHRRTDQVSSLLCESIAHLAFIDGNHDFRDVAHDFEVCDRLLAVEGVLALHDVYPVRHLAYTPKRPDPERCVREVILPTGRYEPLGACHLTLALRKRG